MKYCRSLHPARHAAEPDARRRRHLQRLPQRTRTKRQIDWAARAAALRDVVATRKARSERLRLPHPGERRQGQHLAGRQVPGARPEAARGDLAAAGPHRDRPAQPRQPDRARRRPHRLQINPEVERKFMLKAFERFGSTAIPMHMALFNIPLTHRGALRIPLVVWGENSAFEYGSAEEAHTGFALDGAWLKTYGVTHGTTAADWVGDGADAPRTHALLRPDRTTELEPRPACARCSSAITSRGIREETYARGARARLPRATRRRAPATTTTPTSTTTSSRSTTG